MSTMRRPIAFLSALAYLVCSVPSARAGSKVADVNDPSRGEPKVLALMARQGFEASLLVRGSTLARLCKIRSRAGRPAYTLYWFYHLSQAAVQVHGRAELVVVSAAGNVVGTYDYQGQDKPRCVGWKVYPVDDLPGDQAQYVTTFAADRLPKWLGDGGGFFPATRYEHAPSADGIQLPNSTQ